MSETKPTRKDLRGSSDPLSLEQHLKELLYEAVGWLVEYECTGRFDDRSRGMLRDMIDRGDAAVGNPPNDWEEDDRLAQANAKPTSNPPKTRPSGITPPLGLRQEWIHADEGGPGVIERIAARAAQWGADKELEACVEWIGKQSKIWSTDQLQAARRPQAPSLKQQALELLDKAEDPYWCINDFSVIRLALEQLDD